MWTESTSLVTARSELLDGVTVPIWPLCDACTIVMMHASPWRSQDDVGGEFRWALACRT